MQSTSSIALSGMHAAQVQLRASAHNIANLATDGYRRQQAQLSARADAGVDAQIVHADQAGGALVHDVVSQLQASNAFIANLAVFKSDNRLAGALLDALA